MKIRRAELCDTKAIESLLLQVLTVHHKGRPDIFKGNCRKYTESEIHEMILDDSRPIFVADEEGQVFGYAFCALISHENDHILTDIRTLYIDDLCVDEKARGKKIGSALYNYVCQFAKESGCYNLTLNVWSCNEGAIKFYEKCGLKPQKIGMETIL